MPLRSSALLCALVAGLVLLPAAGAVADAPTPSPPPTSTPTTAVPEPSTTASAPAWDPAVRFAPGAVPGTVTVSWTPAPGAMGYAVVVAGRGRSTTAVPSLLLTGIPAGTDLRIRVVATTASGVMPSAPVRWTAPAAVPVVPDASLVRTGAGLRLRWTPVSGATSYLVELRGADGTDVHRTVRGRSVVFEPLPPETLYSALVTAVAADGRRGPARSVPSTFTASGGSEVTASVPPDAPAPAPASSTRTSAPVAAAVQPQALPSEAAVRPTLVDSPVAAAACAAAAVVLGAFAVLGLLLRRPRGR